MTEQARQTIHRCYNNAARTSHNILDIEHHLYDAIFNNCGFSDEDLSDVDQFLRMLESSINIRKETFRMTNLVLDVAFVMMYIIIWVNNVLCVGADVNLTARRKALESELTKFIRKPEVHDFFGLRLNVLNNHSPADSATKLISLSQSILGILTKSNRKSFSDFQDWINRSEFIDEFARERILTTLQIPFKIVILKDYVKEPKPNGYQSIHAIIGIEMYSTTLPGAEIEIQFRTNYMHQIACNGTANHEQYKAEQDATIKNIFTIDNFDEVNIVGFSSYNSIDDDIDGIHFGKQILSRRISDSLVFL